MTRGRRLAFAIVASSLLAAPVAAQPEGEAPTEEPAPAAEPEPPAAPVKDPKVAKKWQRTGVTLVRKGDALVRRAKPDDAKVQYENALTAYDKAIEHGTDVNVAFERGLVLDKLGRHDEAYKQLAALVKPESGARADIVKKATAKVDELSTKIGLVTLTTKPEGATISLGGNEVGRSPLAEPLVLMPGTYTVALSADGFQPMQTEINVEAGSESERTLELEAVEIVVTPPPVIDDEPAIVPVQASAPSKVPLIIGGGAAVAFLGVATVTGLMAQSEHDTFTGNGSTPDERADAQDKGKRLALITDLCLVGGVAAVGFTAYWYFAKYKPGQRNVASGRESNDAAKLDVVPWVKPDAGGFSVAGSF